MFLIGLKRAYNAAPCSLTLTRSYHVSSSRRIDRNIYFMSKHNPDESVSCRGDFGKSQFIPESFNSTKPTNKCVEIRQSVDRQSRRNSVSNYQKLQGDGHQISGRLQWRRL